LNWIRIISINILGLIILLIVIEILAGFGRILISKPFIFPKIETSTINPCREMKTDVLLSYVPNHRNQCIIKDGYVDGEYVHYNISKATNPKLLVLGGSTTTGFFQQVSSGNAYPKYLADILVNKYNVINGGVGGYSAQQEMYKLIRDSSRIRNLHTIISLNGINELPSYYGKNEIRSVFYPFLTKVQMEMNVNQVWIDQKFEKLSVIERLFPNFNSLFLKLNYQKEALLKKSSVLNNPIIHNAGDRWEINVSRMHSMALIQGIKYYVFLQPTMGLLGVQSSPKIGSYDEKIFKDMQKYQKAYIDEIRSLYKDLKIRCANLDYCFDISDDVQPTGDVYSDPRHHNSLGNSMLAKVIADHLIYLETQ